MNATLNSILADLDSIGLDELNKRAAMLTRVDRKYALDEATASLDVENESAVQQALSRLLVGKTVLVIAHRMRTVMGADHVVVLAEGRVAEDGTPAELLAAGGLFARMASLQGQAADWKL